jgi:hypothetical protein
MSRPTPVLTVSEEQQKQIEQWLAALGTPQQVALRSRIVLAAGLGKSEAAIAAEMNVKSKDGSFVAGTIRRTRVARSLGDRAGPWPQGHFQSEAGQRRDRRYLTVEAERNDSLELPAHGGAARS